MTIVSIIMVVMMFVLVMGMLAVVMLVIVIWFLFGSQDESRTRWSPVPG